MTTTKQVATYYLNEQIYRVLNDRLATVSYEEIERQASSGKQHRLIVSDRYLFHQTSDFGEKIQKSKGKLVSVIKAHYMMKFGVSVDSIGYYKMAAGNTVINTYNEALRNIIEDYPMLFQQAEKISSVFLESYLENNNFVYQSYNAYYKVTNGAIEVAEQTADEVVEKIDEESGLEQIIYRIRNNELLHSYSFPKIRRGLSIYLNYIPHLVVSVVIVALLAVNIAVTVNAKSKTLNKYEELLVRQFQIAGVADSADPFRSLIDKVGDSSADGIKEPLKIIAAVSDLPDEVVLTGLIMNPESNRITGNTSDVSLIDDYIEMLSEKGTAVINSTSLGSDGKHKFDIKFTAE